MGTINCLIELLKSDRRYRVPLANKNVFKRSFIPRVRLELYLFLCYVCMSLVIVILSYMHVVLVSQRQFSTQVSGGQ